MSNAKKPTSSSAGEPGSGGLLVLEGKAAPDREQVIEDLDQLQATFDPMRSKILRLLSAETLSVKDLALRLGVTPTRLYHHMGVLEEKGFIHTVETRTAGKNVERVYGLTASRFPYAPDLASLPSLGRTDLRIADMQDTIRDLAQAYRDQDAGVFGKPGTDFDGLTIKVSTKFSRQRAQKFIAELHELVDRYASGKDKGYGYTFFAAFTPTDPS